MKPQQEISIRKATRDDLSEIVRMLADDFLGSQRERYEEPLPQSYYDAFEEIERDNNNELIVVEREGKIIGTLQLTFIPSISFQGRKRAQIESVRVDDDYRGKGIGRKLMLWAIKRARQEKCLYVQLTTNNERTDAHRFYFNLGFTALHTGMKLRLD